MTRRQYIGRYLAYGLPTCVFIGAGGFVGCSTLQLPEPAAASVDQQPSKIFEDGIAIGVRPITDREEAKKQFGADLLSSGLLAVSIVIENRSAASGYVFQKERCRLGNIGESGEAGMKKLGDETVAIALASTLGVGTMILGAKLGSDAKIIKDNLIVREFQAKTLNPGETANGYLYFQVGENKKATAVKAWVLHAEALELKTGTYRAFEIPF